MGVNREVLGIDDNLDTFRCGLWGLPAPAFYIGYQGVRLEGKKLEGPLMAAEYLMPQDVPSQGGASILWSASPNPSYRAQPGA